MIKIAHLPAELKPTSGFDVRDIQRKPGGEEWVRQAIEDAQEWQPPQEDGMDDSRPVVLIRHDEEKTVQDAVAALATRDDLYQRSNQLVGLVTDVQPPRGVTRSKHALRISELDQSVIRSRIAAAGYVGRLNDDNEFVPAHPPEWLVRSVANQGEWEGIRYLAGVVETPILRPDGSILQQPGYDPATAVVYAPRIDYPEVPESPTQEDAIAAVEQLRELVIDFPFVNAAHESAFLAALITPGVRYAYSGPTPLFAIDATTPGTGKTLLADAIGNTWAGADIPKTAFPSRNDDEVRKRITAIAVASEPLVLIDNIGAALDSPSFDAALTATSWNDRVLGHSRMTGNIPLNCIWLATGNNLTFGADTPRRALLIRLEAETENPEERSDFKHPNLRKWILENRGRLVAAALTIVRAFHLAGRPDMGLRQWGSFEGWSKWLREPLVWAGLPDPSNTREFMDADSNREVSVLRLLLDAWEEIDPHGAGIAVRPALKLLDAPDADDEYPALSAAVTELTPLGKKPSAKSIGMKLHHFKGRICGGRRFVRGDDGRSGAMWKIEKANDCGTSATNGTNLYSPREKKEIDIKEGVRTSPAGLASPARCDHLDSTTWVEVEGRLHCPGCNRFMGRMKENSDGF